MTIKQQGGIFGRNPTFNDLTVEGTLSVPSDSISGDAIDGGTATLDGLTVDTNTLYVDEINHRLGIGTSTPGTKVEVYAPAGTSSDLVMRLRATDGAASYGSVVDLTTTATGSQVADFIIATRDGSNITETLRCKGNGDVSVNRGNLVIGTSGKGIDFSATSGTGTSELFDDYEEGTFSPTITCSTSGTITLESSGDTAFYTKIGRLVTMGGRLIVNSASSPTGNLFITNLPFSANFTVETAGLNSGSAILYNTSSDIVGGLAVEMASTYTTSILIRDGNGTSAGVNSIANKIDGDSIISFSISYVTV